MKNSNNKIRWYRDQKEIDEEINLLKNTKKTNAFLSSDEIQKRKKSQEQDVEMPSEFKKFHKENKDRVFNIYNKNEIEKLSIEDFMNISEQKLIVQQNYFDREGKGELNQNEMREMGNHLGISNKMMDIMCKEIDTDEGGTISSNEWVEYVMKSRKQKDEIREHNNILLDIQDKYQNEHHNSDHKSVDRKFNININDSYKLNEIELEDAYKIADKMRSNQKQEIYKIAKRSSDIYNQDQFNVKDDNIEQDLSVKEEDFKKKNYDIKVPSVPSFKLKKESIKRNNQRNSLSVKLDDSQKLEPSELVKIKQSKSFKENIFDEEDEREVEVESQDLNELEEYFNSNSDTNNFEISELEDSIFNSSTTFNTDSRNERKYSKNKQKKNKELLDVIDEAIENNNLQEIESKKTNKYDQKQLKDEKVTNINNSQDWGKKKQIKYPSMNHSPKIASDYKGTQKREGSIEKKNCNQSIKNKKPVGVFSNIAKSMFKDY